MDWDKHKGGSGRRSLRGINDSMVSQLKSNFRLPRFILLLDCLLCSRLQWTRSGARANGTGSWDAGRATWSVNEHKEKG
jgi:hypothetical protein